MHRVLRGDLRRRVLVLLLGLSNLGLSGSPVLVQAGEEVVPAGRGWAVLIGIEKYRKQGVDNLVYTVNDVNQLALTLEHRGGFTRDGILT